MRPAILFLIFSTASGGQTFTFGVLGGVRTTGSFTGNLADESKRDAIGPSVDLQLPLGFSVEVDALYRRFGYSSTFVVPIVPGSVTITRERDNTWELPALVKYHLPIRGLHPFAGLGIAPRVISGRRDQYGYSIDPLTRLPSQPFAGAYTPSYGPDVGLVIAGGLELGIGHVRLTPQIRWTRWNERFLDEIVRNMGFLGLEYYQASQRQSEIMIGIGWRTR